MPIKAKFITEITLIDPDTNLEVQVTIYKENGGGMFGVDSSYLANTELPVYSPFIRGRVVKIEEEIHLEEKPQTYDVLFYYSIDSYENFKPDYENVGFPAKEIAMNFVEEKKKDENLYAIKVQSKDREEIEIFKKIDNQWVTI